MSWNGHDLGSPKVILRGIPKGFIHNGGRLRWTGRLSVRRYR